LLLLALLANACYCAAYVVEIPMHEQSLHAMWAKRRWILWLMGTLFAVVFETIGSLTRSIPLSANVGR
jgi:hypothetical protein